MCLTKFDILFSRPLIDFPHSFSQFLTNHVFNPHPLLNYIESAFATIVAPMTHKQEAGSRSEVFFFHRSSIFASFRFRSDLKLFSVSFEFLHKHTICTGL